MTLEDYVREGYSAGVAADALGITRSAAIGRAYRLGLCFRSGANQHTRKPRSNVHLAKLTVEERREKDRLRKAQQAKERTEFKPKLGAILGLRCGWSYRNSARNIR